MYGARWGIIFFLLLLAGLDAEVQAQSRIEIDQIEIEGVTVFSQEEIEVALELGPGDRLERAKVVQTAKNLQALYQVRGYQDAQVRSELIRRRIQGKVQNILKIVIQEGPATLISGYQLIAGDIRNESSQELWDDLKKSLQSQIGLRIGDVFDQERITEISRSIEAALASEEFIGARLNDVRIFRGEPPKEFSKNEKNPWVLLEFHVDLGDRVTFGFRGNTVFSRNELMELIAEQRLVGFAKDYISSIGQKIQEKYRSKGFAHIQVVTRTFEKPLKQERHVTYEIQEGPRVLIENVAFDGNIYFSADDLYDAFFDKAPLLVQRGYYAEEDVNSAGQLLLEYIKSKGYLSSKLVTINRKFYDEDKRVNLLVYLYEGERTIVRDVKIEGNKKFSNKEIMNILGLEIREGLNLFAFNEGIETLKSKYKGSGHLGFKIDNEDEEEDTIVRYSQQNRLADIHLRITEGPLFRVGEIQIAGLDKTKPYIVERELRFNKGDVIEDDKLRESEKRLRKLGIFSNVTIQTRDVPYQEGYKNIRVIVKEADKGIVAGGVGIRNDLGIRLFGTLAYTSVWHRNHTWSLTGSVNRRFEDFCTQRGSSPTTCFAEFQLQVGYAWPWFLIDEMTLRPTLTWEKRRFEQFDAESVGLRIALERPLMERVNLIGGMTYSLERVRQFNAVNPVDNQTLNIGAIIPSLRLDLRDNPLAPSKGFFSSVSYEIASELLGSQSEPFPVAYTRAQFRADQFIPLGEKITWFLSFRTGFARNTAEGSSPEIGIPLSKQFALGGVRSLRGFDLQELNKQDIQIRGTLSFVNYRTQVDLPLAGAMRFGPFLDAGNLLVDSYSLGQLRYGVGFGFHYQTPVGPVNFDWGFKVDPKPGEDPQAFYFSVGIL